MRTNRSGPPPVFGHHGPGREVEIQRAKDARRTVARLWGYLRKERATLALASCTATLSTGLALAGPYLMGVAIDRYILPGDLPGLFRICGLMLGVHVATSGLVWLQAYAMVGASQRTIRAVRADVFAKLPRLPLRFFDEQPHGDVMSRLTNDVERINSVLTDSVGQIVSGALTMVGVLVVMLLMNPPLTAVSLTTLALMTFGLTRYVSKRTREGFRKQQAALGALNGMIEETISGQRVVKAYGREPAANAEFDRSNSALRQASTQALIYSGLIGPFMNFIGNSSLAVVAGVGGAMVVGGMATVGTIASFINYTRQFARPMNEFASLYSTILSALAGAERVFELLDREVEVDARDEGSEVRLRGDVVFEGVGFGYDPAVPVLKGISLHARAGQTVALIGPTGAGKTTVVNLLTRFYEIDEGRILIDGKDLREFPKEALRRQLGIVLQDTYLFARTVRENIRYGRLEASDEEVEAAARVANADPFIRHLPRGYDTVLTERGENLSHGQRQLLAIARAVLADPQILILDEATSSVDTRTERHIQEAMLRLMRGRTSFVIAHRLSTVREADQILAIRGGEVVERGTHDELVAQRGYYHGLVGG